LIGFRQVGKIAALPKPFGVNDLLLVIRQVCRRAKLIPVHILLAKSAGSGD
jgi:hypothetical protein